MIYIVTAENRHLFRHALLEMHRQRKALFIDRMGWALQAPDGLEIDAFDSEEAIYLIAADAPRAPVRASVRLLPTARPHLMSEVFAGLCGDGVPRGAAIWEASRFCPSPQLTVASQGRAALGLMIAGIMEAALIFGVEEITYVAGAGVAPLAMRAGWSARPLGPSQRLNGERIGAFAAAIDAEGLKRVRDRHGFGQPLTRYAPSGFALAA